MSNYTELPLFKAGYDLTIELFKTTKEFNKEYKYTLGERIKSNGLDLMLLLYRANSIKDKSSTLQIAREKLEDIRLCYRLMFDLKQVALKKWVMINEKIELVSRQLAGWHKSVLK
jgi:hypothetical protein